MRETVVLIHGIWMVGVEMGLLRKRIERCEFECCQYRYHSIRSTPADNARRLHDYLQTLETDIVHLVAHSLGGLVVMHLFDQFPMQKPGRVLMLATPIKGSALARRMNKIPVTGVLLGKSINQGLLGDAPRWKQTRELGMIAGNTGMGLGSLVIGGLQGPNDGTVAVEETRAPEINAHLIVPYSHSTMLWSSAVADAVCNFLQTGGFE
ncbi:MAG: esterase/lipase family protein [Gammaproteobacteria bacterium]